MKRSLQGKYIKTNTTGETVNAFIPAPLPPDPPIDWGNGLRNRFDNALLALGRLDGVALLLPDISFLLYMYVRKEAVLSSMIEGTQSSLSDLLLYEAQQKPTVPVDDVQEVCNYIAAMDFGLSQIKDGFPLSLRLLRNIHSTLLSKGRGSTKNPGEFRTSQNWIGGTRPGNAYFVPPPADEVMECMGKLELFLHNEPEETSPLLKAALAHLQFETIHPFLDGNGRLGRLLITLILCEENVLRAPLLYLSLYFKTHRQDYYKLLNDTRVDGDWEAWLEFFAEAVTQTAKQAEKVLKDVLALIKSDREKLKTMHRTTAAAISVLDALVTMPVTTSAQLSQKCGLTQTTINKLLSSMEKFGIVTRMDNRKRNKVYLYAKYIAIVDRGLETEREQ